MIFNSVLKENWVEKKFDNQEAIQISQKFSLNEITSRLLSIKKIGIQNIELFLNPTIKNTMPNPYDLSDMESAVKRIYQSIQKKETLGIFGDYDVDGASSTALLKKFFLEINQNIETYIPDRQKDGYGPNINAFGKLIRDGSKAIITVDCGTSSFEAIEFAKKNKVDVIVLDHHQSDIKLPKAHSIVNPNKFDDKSNLNYLCAAGVTFMFLVALNKKLRELNWYTHNKINEPNILNLLDLVCLGTICDVVPLIGLNRALVNQGLKVLKQRSNLGLKTLYDMCNIQSRPTPYHVGYIIGPRINAGGRVGKSSYGADLLTSNNSEHAYKLANELTNLNKQRQNLEQELLTKVDNMAEKNQSYPIMVLSGDDWHEGIIGIIASRIKDKYHKPTFIISVNGNNGKGSARSIFGFDVGASIISAVQLGILNRGGGHKMAGGFSIEKNKISQFREFLIKKIKNNNLFNKKTNNLYFDAIISPSALNENFFKDIHLLSPFGSGNTEPIFVIRDMKIVNSTIIGDKHIKIIMTGKNGEIIRGIAFNSKGGILESYLSKSYKKNIDIAGKITLNEWHGEKRIEFLIQDIAVN